jgi:addiction module RelE/StbE family toxin
MINIIWDDPFAKKLKKILKKHPELLNLFKDKITLLSIEPFDVILKTHKLTGQLKEYYACSVNYEYRLIFKIIDANNIFLIDIGSHDEVY